MTNTSSTGDYQAPAKGSFPIQFGLNQQKPLKDLTLLDLFLWRNLFVSAILFVLVHATYLLLTKYQFTVITLVGRVIQIQVITFFLYIVFARIVKNTSGTIDLPFADFRVSKELVEPYVQSLVEKFNSIISRYLDILMCKNLLSTIQFIVIVQVICVVGKKIEGVHSLYALLNVLFIVPLVYEWQQEKIDQLLQQAFAKIKEVVNQGLEKIPPNIREQLSHHVGKIEGPKEKSE